VHFHLSDAPCPSGSSAGAPGAPGLHDAMKTPSMLMVLNPKTSPLKRVDWRLP